MDYYQHLEYLAEQVHNAWMKEMHEQGFHAPCTEFDIPCDKCHTDMVPYAELPENIKEYDRVTVRTVLDAINMLED